MKRFIRPIYLKVIKQIAIFRLIFVSQHHIPLSGNTGISSLVCHAHIHMFIYALTSFYFHSKHNLPCTVIDDGSLTANDHILLKRHFPEISIITRSEADIQIKKILHKFPAILKFRDKQNIHKFHLKLTDPFLLSPYKKIIYMDSDVLFVNAPVRIQRWIDSSERTYLYEPEYRTPDWGIGDGWNFAGNAIREALEISFDERFNSGLLCMDKQLYPLQFINKVVTYMQRVEMDKTWIAEQYAMAAAFAYRNAKKFGSKYKHLALPDRQVFQNVPSFVSIHFAYLAKLYYYREALKQTIRT